MDKKKSKYKDDYSLRTLAYYQREGGVYNELITILQRMRAGKGGRKILPPKDILNAATDAFDMYMDRCRDNETNNIVDCGWNEMAWEIYGGCVPGPFGGWEGKNELTALCVLCVLLSRHPEFNEASVPEISEIVKEQDSSLFEDFAKLIWNNIESQDAKLESLKIQLSIREALIREKDSQIAELSNRNSELEKKVATIEPVYDAYVKNIIEESNFNQYLTLDTILVWISKRKHYKLADQVIAMLKDLARKTATDKEFEKIESIESELLSKYSEFSIVNNNMGIGSNILTGITSNPSMPMGYDQNQLTQKFLEFISNGTRRDNKD